MQGRRVLQPPMVLLTGLAAAIVVDLALPAARVLPLPWRFVGLLPLAAGVALNLVADRDLKRHRTTVKPDLPPTELVTDGAFAWSRNPMYCGFVLVVLGTATLLGSLASLVTVPLLALALDRGFVAVEERTLGARFGDAWTRYRQRVQRWL